MPADENSIAVHYEVTDGEAVVELFSGQYDVDEEWSSDAWSDLATIDSHTLGTGGTVSVKLRRP